MNKGTFRFIAHLFLITVVILGMTLGGSVSGLAAGPDEAETVDVQVARAWARPAIVGGNGAVYFALTNESEMPVTLISAKADVAEVVEIHQTLLLTEEEAAALQHGHDHDHHNHHDHSHHQDHHHDHHGHDHGHDHHAHHGHDHEAGGAGVFVMLHVDKLEVAPKEQVIFGPAGYHIMLIGLTKTLAWDETFPLTLHFEEIPPVTVLVKVGNEPDA